MAMRKRWLVATLVMVAVFGVAAVAGAHPGHHHHGGEGLLGGVIHPWGGLDHLVAALLVGAWAVMSIEERSTLLLPGAFLGAMGLGAVAMAVGVGAGVAGGLTALTVVALGLVLGFRWSVPVSVGVGAMALFGLIHGASHMALGAGLSVATATYLLGLMLSTAVLHALGVAGAGLAMRSKRSVLVTRLAGTAAAVAGVVLMLHQWLIG